jgi:hypothetical protein
VVDGSCVTELMALPSRNPLYSYMSVTREFVTGRMQCFCKVRGTEVISTHFRGARSNCINAVFVRAIEFGSVRLSPIRASRAILPPLCPTLTKSYKNRFPRMIPSILCIASLRLARAIAAVTCCASLASALVLLLVSGKRSVLAYFAHRVKSQDILGVAGSSLRFGSSEESTHYCVAVL